MSTMNDWSNTIPTGPMELIEPRELAREEPGHRLLIPMLVGACLAGLVLALLWAVGVWQ